MQGKNIFWHDIKEHTVKVKIGFLQKIFFVIPFFKLKSFFYLVPPLPFLVNVLESSQTLLSPSSSLEIQRINFNYNIRGRGREGGANGGEGS